MGKDSQKYNPSTDLKKRTKLSEPSNSFSYSDLIGFSNKIPEHKNFTEKDLDNGFRELIPKK